MACRTGLVSRRPITTVKRAGLTLLELMVVLAIMVALATIATQAIEPRINQSRYEATQQTLENIQVAILGDPNARQPDGTPLITGFVADMGRFPISLGELVVQGSLPGAAVQTAADHPEIKLWHGWRGPYLKLSPTATAIRDGWGREFLFEPGDTPGTYLCQSFGSDGIKDTISPPTDPYMQDQKIELKLVTVSGNVVNVNGDPVPAATVKLYLPQLGTHLISDIDDEDDTNAFQFNDVPAGTRVIRAEAGTLVGVQYLRVPQTGLMNVVITVR
jgi:prepilin-type N-terminal cleavage/methylation domain-containing protein